MNKPHLFWILIDSARNYESNQDDRGLPKAVREFGNEGLYFKNVITSAPSTLQSISSMMTSSPSYLMSRSYNNFRGKFSCFDYFPDMLKSAGYEIIGAIYFKHGREVMSDMFGLLKKNYYPNSLSHSKEVWTNEDVYNLFKQVLNKHNWKVPTMTYLHFNVRVDDNISTILNKVIKDLKDQGLFDNSVVLMNSDHGYPDKDKGYDFEESLKEGWGHDKYLTNDNILTPLVIRYPNVKPQVINDAVATIDIVPTLCELMGIEGSKKFHGINLNKKDIDHSSRLIRTDNRYIGQTPSFHAYTLGNQKAIIYRQKGKEDVYSFYDLKTDPFEKFPSQDFKKFDTLYKAIIQDENQLYDFHADFLKSKWQKVFAKEIASNPNQVVIVLPSSPTFQKVVIKVIKEIFPISTVNFHTNTGKHKVDLLIYIIESEIPWELKSLKEQGKGIIAEKVVFTDNNGIRMGKYVLIEMYKYFIAKRWPLIRQEPAVLFDVFSRIFKKRLLNPVK